jgi:hypothetical protein
MIRRAAVQRRTLQSMNPQHKRRRIDASDGAEEKLPLSPGDDSPHSFGRLGPPASGKPSISLAGRDNSGYFHASQCHSAPARKKRTTIFQGAWLFDIPSEHNDD